MVVLEGWDFPFYSMSQPTHLFRLVYVDVPTRTVVKTLLPSAIHVGSSLFRLAGRSRNLQWADPSLYSPLSLSLYKWLPRVLSSTIFLLIFLFLILGRQLKRLVWLLFYGVAVGRVLSLPDGDRLRQGGAKPTSRAL